MYLSYTCLECGKTFSADKERLEYSKNSVGTQAKKHIREYHNISIKDYVVKHYFNGITPTCQCGCGAEVSFTPKNCLWSDEHGFRKYCHCSHKRGDSRINVKETEAYKAKWKNKDWVIEHYDKLYGLKYVKQAADEFLDENQEYTLAEISNKYNMHIHTLKNIWFKLNYMTEEQYKEKAKKNKSILSQKHRITCFANADEVCEELYNILKNFPLKYTITSLIDYYNSINLIQIKNSRYQVLSELTKKFGNELYSYLLFGAHSKEELEFIKILKYYFGKSNVKVGKKLQYGKIGIEYYIYDCCINDRILIEYDGNGFYHSSEEAKNQDKNKETFAIEHNYIFIRISDKSAKDPNTLIKIKNILNND